MWLRGSSFVNGSGWEILTACFLAKKERIVYGVSASGIAKIVAKRMAIPIEVYCPYST